jgi:hypothetical protein
MKNNNEKRCPHKINYEKMRKIKEKNPEKLSFEF